jgi:hypothetical protein
MRFKWPPGCFLKGIVAFENRLLNRDYIQVSTVCWDDDCPPDGLINSAVIQWAFEPVEVGDLPLYSEMFFTPYGKWLLNG